MSEETDGLVLLIYSIVLGVAAAIFYVAKKRAKNINKKKQINNISSLFLSILMFFSGYIMGFPIVPLIIFIGIGVLITYASSKSTSFCGSCGYEHTQPFSKIKYCPKCGAKIEKTPNNRLHADHRA
ncbi:hypothetical protein [Perlucidibaca aquatica]|uniref:hypothetical protein n=1 Tax=Perlucidibaca aquatica TaxID=1852776 RepID=UPI0012FDEE72|nr:hypothetical protein [Perlucidibaca aquatica]